MKRVEDAREAERLGANYLGVILTASPRRVSTDEALRVFEAAPTPRRVGVVASGHIETIANTARLLDLDILQLHGAFHYEEISRLREEFDGQIWAVAPVDESGEITEAWHQISDSVDALLLDTSVGGRIGGTGRTFNWKSAAPAVKKISMEVPIVLAGGLNPENVSAAIGILHPAIVDVSSGVEALPGVKDHNLMQAFAKAARSASMV
jgi:phosphoribosylanthranilate isomerase